MCSIAVRATTALPPAEVWMSLHLTVATLVTGSGEQLTFKDWYVATANHRALGGRAGALRGALLLGCTTVTSQMQMYVFFISTRCYSALNAEPPLILS